MPDYKKMYFQLFNAVTRAVELLQREQLHTEESYIARLPPDLREVPADSEEENA